MSSQPLDQERFDLAKAVFLSLPESVDEIFRDNQTAPIAGSIAWQEYVAFPGDEGIQTVYGLALAEIQAAADHMFAMERVFTSPVMPISPWSIARAVLELTAIACWLLVPDLSPPERIARGMNIRLKSFREEIRFTSEISEQSPGQAAKIVKEAEEQIDQLRRDAKTRRVNEKLDKSGRLTGFDEGMPSPTKMCQIAFGDASLYRIFSGLAHGLPWAIFALTMPNLRQTKIISPEINIAQGVFLLNHCLDWYSRTVWNFASLHGWDIESLAVTLESEYDKAEMNSESRFWRNLARD